MDSFWFFNDSLAISGNHAGKYVHDLAVEFNLHDCPEEERGHSPAMRAVATAGGIALERIRKEFH